MFLLQWGKVYEWMLSSRQLFKTLVLHSPASFLHKSIFQPCLLKQTKQTKAILRIPHKFLEMSLSFCKRLSWKCINWKISILQSISAIPSSMERVTVTTFKRLLNRPPLLLPDEAGDVNVDEGGHEVLAVKPIHDAPVTRDGVGKILKQVKKKRERERRERGREREGKVPGGYGGAAGRRAAAAL